jgi:hypothetical protein
MEDHLITGDCIYFLILHVQRKTNLRETRTICCMPKQNFQFSLNHRKIRIPQHKKNK